jgi:hypothetical protein
LYVGIDKTVLVVTALSLPIIIVIIAILAFIIPNMPFLSLTLIVILKSIAILI